MGMEEPPKKDKEIVSERQRESSRDPQKWWRKEAEKKRVKDSKEMQRQRGREMKRRRGEGKQGGGTQRYTGTEAKTLPPQTHWHTLRIEWRS